MLIKIALISAGFILFALVHSVFANHKWKKRLFKQIPGLKVYYRLIYNIISIITLLAWYLLMPFPDGRLYVIEFPGNIIFRILQLAGAAGFFISLREIDVAQFLGFRQIRTYLNSGRMPDRLDEFSDQDLIIRGLYRYVRHPLYTTSIAVLAFNPAMSYKLAIITVLFTLYFYIGSIHEEKNLVKIYGQKYIDYQKKVPRLIPKFTNYKSTDL